MEEKELTEKIRKEELIKLEVQKEHAKVKSPKGSTIWKFLNSHFGLFVFSSIVLGVISWGYGEFQLTTKITIENEQLAHRLLTEIQYRNSLLELKFDDASNAADSNIWMYIYDIEDIVKGRVERFSNGKKSFTEFTPVFKEYSDRGMHSLYWEYIFTEEKNRNISRDHTIKVLSEFNILLNKLIVNDLDSDEGFTSDDLKKLKKLFYEFRGDSKYISK